MIVRGKTIAFALGSSALVGLAVTGLLQPAEAPRHAVRSVATPAARTAPQEVASAAMTVHSTGKPSSEARGTLLSLATAAARVRATARDGDRLAAEIAAMKPGPGLAGERVRLERVLRERPELGPAAARAFERLEGREVTFCVGRALATVAGEPEVRSVLDAAAAGGNDERREAALVALPDDPGALVLARHGFDDRAASPNVRAASAFLLARSLDALPDAERATVLEKARVAASAPGEDPHLRAEALHLLARAGSPIDAARAADALAPDQPAEVSLAAAHLALATGTEPREVASALERHGDRACASAAQQLLATRRNP